MVSVTQISKLKEVGHFPPRPNRTASCSSHFSKKILKEQCWWTFVDSLKNNKCHVVHQQGNRPFVVPKNTCHFIPSSNITCVKMSFEEGVRQTSKRHRDSSPYVSPFKKDSNLFV